MSWSKLLLYVERSKAVIHKESVWDWKRGWWLPPCSLGYVYTSKQKRNELEHWISDCQGWAHSLVLFWMFQLVSPRQLCYKKESRWTSSSPGSAPLPFLSSMHISLGPGNLIFLLACWSWAFWGARSSRKTSGRCAGLLCHPRLWARGDTGGRGQRVLNAFWWQSPVKVCLFTFPTLPGYRCGGWKTHVLLFFLSVAGKWLAQPGAPGDQRESVGIQRHFSWLLGWAPPFPFVGE